MIFGLVLLNVLSLFLLAALFGLSLLKRRTSGAIAFGILMFFTFVWSLGTFVELNAPSLEAKVFWRNFTQFGTFYLPAAAIIFSLSHTGASRRIIGGLSLALSLWQLIPISLIWTDASHHLMRVAATLETDASGSAILVVKQTILGMVFVAINYALMATAVAILLVNAFRKPATRTPLLIVVAGMVLPSVFSSLINMMGTLAFGGIPAASSFALSAVIVLFGVRNHGFLMLSPIARDRAFEVIDEGILVSAATGEIVDLNRAARRMLIRNYSLPQDAPAVDFGRALSHTLSASIPELCAAKERRFSLKFNNGDGLAHYLLRSYELKNNGGLIGFTSVLQDVSDSTNRMNLLIDKAERDPLTGIYNKQAFYEIVSNRLKYLPAGTGFLMIFDIDHFKDFNDGYGHLSGDAVLQEVCRRCQKILREADIFGRVGGDEFALFFAGLDAEVALSVADRIRSNISSQTIPVAEGQAVSVTISAGIAGSAPAGDLDPISPTYEDLFARADAALYQSKAAGRNRVSLEDR
jgi:diguanylate cyclase (GGDEF)-like protein